MGLQNLSHRDRKKVTVGNQLLWFTARIVLACLLFRIPFAVENPHSSRCWITPVMKEILDHPEVKFLELHFCQFGERWKKPTGIMHAFVDLSCINSTCRGVNKICSATGRKHVPLKGQLNGVFMTLIAQPYPFQLTRVLSQSLKKQCWLASG